jgi:hypothetical protein
LPFGAIFSPKNGSQKCCNFAGLLQRNQKLQKAGFLPQKIPVHAAKNAENGAFLAHLEPKILLIEVAYFSAATVYTFSAHCNFEPYNTGC